MASAEKIDLYKQFKSEYVMPKKPALITANEATYLAICGQGAPSGEDFTNKIGALYGVAFTIKMTRKFADMGDYAVCKLEGQWWHDGKSEDFADISPDKWKWKLMIRTPDFISKDELQKAVSTLLSKGKSQIVREVMLESINEGLCVQMLHIGPYQQENKTINEMKALAGQKGLEFHGLHHEIYLSDPRRIPPERLKTILRHPVRKK